MPDQMTAALILAVGIMIAAFVTGGRYSIAPAREGEHGIVYIIDRFTGLTQWCGPTFCRTLILQ